ncbi:hypothetical protein [Flavilitoribacter nigricans]|uniref:XRE family transcriptional regulator n=1 Tax=Flavilitoribacter nigricans (strain ATCC 23147 / DSM 23189 / NBRC 102662 / NCIMB 1420 / SS-2) TaxID=1122177 RepID=A0A2D0NJY8_FLAN2|nr:hypothetical protein [Flavilitoribacter nigricans]PHN08686.1 hypothetical protein CRP01_01885 [Flavilitoribacter nigricans DSM 23189 = NBRC 102662]
MFSKNDVTPLKMALSKYYNNYFEIIGEKTQLSRPTISKFFNAKKVKPDNALKIYDVCIDLLLEKERDIKELQQKIKELT